MEVLNFIFRIGVILAIYNFLWWVIMLGIRILRGLGQKQLLEVYIIKTVRYLFLVDVVFLFTYRQSESNDILLLNNLLIAGLILLIYFLGKIQSKQQRLSLFSIKGQVNIPGMSDLFNRIKPVFDIRFEVIVLVLTLGVFFGFYFAPHLASNVISLWFLDSILNIEDTPVFGFIFKVIGFFFLLSVIFKVVGGFLTVLSAGNRSVPPESKDDDRFDDYTEIK